MPTTTGPLILADISGYTAFVADTELEHSREILNELLETMVRCLSKHVRIGQIEGDAIFGLGETVPPGPLGWIEDCFVRFHRHLRFIKQASECSCRACTNVGTLTLKFIWHHGEYLPQRFGDKETFVGKDVNLVHRLLKNQVPSREYLFVTAAALERFPSELRSRFSAHDETYDLGAVTGGWLDLSSLRTDPRLDEDIRVVDPAHAVVTLEHVLDASAGRVWAALIDAPTRRRFMGVRRIDYTPGARRSLAGGEFHCVHGGGTSVLRVVSSAQPKELTIFSEFAGVKTWCTTRLEQLPDGRTKVIDAFHFEPPPGPIGALRGAFARRMYLRHVRAGYPRLRAILAEPEVAPAAV